MYSAWIKAIDLELWAPQLEARGLFPGMVRQLIKATTVNQELLRFPASEGIQRPGWDGELKVETGNAWVPTGHSVWELSTSESPETRANENYDKRTKATPAAEASSQVFVFATPRKWINKKAWESVKNSEGKWRGVKVLDSDDFEHWFEDAPAVDTWASRLCQPCR